MVDQLVVGCLYSKSEIVSKGFVNTKNLTVYKFYRKDNTLLIFDNTEPNELKLHRLVSLIKE